MYNGSLYVTLFFVYKCFIFCVHSLWLLCVGDSDFPIRRLDKKIYSKFADSRFKEKKRVHKDKNENANNVFYAISAHPSHMQFLLKS